jgi:hypothetical protein
MSYKQPREVLIPYLEKIEADLLRYDMHSELLTVYSTLKKVHLFSDKYFHYTRLFNKHVALYLSIEKSEEILGNFNRILGQYNFSKSQQLLDTLLFIRTEIANQLSLNPSRQIEIIANLIEVQLNIFCEVPLLRESNVEDLLEITRSCEGEFTGIDYKTYVRGQFVPVCGECFWCKEREWAIEQNQ